MPRRRNTVAPVAAINVTSLLDIVFVLLITFMIVAPALKHGVELELPTVRRAPAISPEKPLELTVRVGDGTPIVMLEGESIALEGLVAAIRAKSPSDTQIRPVTLAADRRIDWDMMARVITELRTGGIENIGIITQTKES